MIRRILVANRGEIARRIFRTCQKLRIQTVAVYSDGDAGEPHVAEADESVNLAGSTAAETYLDHEAIVDAALESGADAIHPGYGFLSESAAFARAVQDAGIVWIGPSPEAIASMGSKIQAKTLMTEAGVPCLPDAGLNGLADREILDAAAGIGYPVLVKASAGGGGKGMRVVAGPETLLDEVTAAAREARGAFGDDALFLEKYLTGPRHIEIQIFGDTHGNVVSLHERECSIQRRHQKIIEESPSPVMTADLRERMGEAAIAAASAVSYVGAGTVEFLFQDGEFFFLEMNTRLQVEHPVTEMVTGLDLVEMQILVAGGSPLPKTALEPPLQGHAIEARIYAEDPENGFLPVTGPVHRFEFQPDAGVRVDSGVDSGSLVSIHFDPMLAKVIVHAPDRSQAAATLATALRQAHIHSSTTNRDLLVRILEHETFLAGDADTGFIEEVGLAELATPLVGSDDLPAYALAAAVADRSSRLETSPVRVPGFRNVGVDVQRTTYDHGDDSVEVAYANTRRGVLAVSPENVEILEVTPPKVTLALEGEALDLEVSRYGDVRYVDSEVGSARFVVTPRFPTLAGAASIGSLQAPMPGNIVRIEVSEGEEVENGQTLMVLEAMKMEHTLRAPHSGVVKEIDCAVGDQVEANQVLIVVE